LQKLVPPGCPLVSVNSFVCERRRAEGYSGLEPRNVRIYLRMQASGIAPEVLSKLFAPFSQADTSITRRFGGTGLGLAISRHFCRMMGGDISARSAPGQGSTFQLSLPVRQPKGAS